MEKTERDAELLKQSAYAQGFAQGLEEGKIKGQEQGYLEIVQKGNGMLQELEQITADYQTSVKTLLNSLEGRVMEMVATMVKNITKNKIDENNEVVLSVIRSAGDRMLERDVAKLLVHRADMELVLANKNALIAGIDTITDLEILPGNTVDQGGCIIETGSGMIDARIETQLEAFDEIFGAV
jgi:flagellar assembly protein FliH